MQPTKTKITTVIKEYIKLFPQEYEAFLNSTRAKQDNVANKYAELGNADQLVRHLFDVPATLHTALRSNLTDEEFSWLFSLNEYERKRAGLTWFIRAFPQFKITKDF